MLEVADLIVAYQKEQPILKSVNISVSEGEILGILGMNGAGKTTLFNTIYGLTTPLKGEIKPFNSLATHANISYL